METIQLVLGGKNTYLGSRTVLEGESSVLSSDVGYLVEANEHLDMNFVAYHTGKKTESRMDASGVLRENGFKLFRGTIDFRKGCAGAVGNEKEDVLLLDDAVVNQTIPLILCEEEDVEGNQGYPSHILPSTRYFLSYVNLNFEFLSKIRIQNCYLLHIQ